MMDLLKAFDYKVFWSEEDGRFVAIALEYPSLSWVDDSPVKALNGLLHCLSDDYKSEVN